MAKQANGVQRVLIVSFSQWYDSYTDNVPGGGSNDGQQLRVVGCFGTCNADGSEIRNASYLEDFKHSISGDMLEGFRVRCTAERSEGELRREGQKVEYYNVLTVNKMQARGMAKVFDAVERGLEKAAERDGWYENAGQYLSRVARSVGATRILIQKKSLDSRSGLYEWDQYVNLSLREAVNMINSRMRDWAGGAHEQQSQIGY
jgi:hypothetical protein